MKTWQGRIASPAHPLYEAFSSSVVPDGRLAQYDIRASRAHARTLARAGVISAEDAGRVEAALDEIAAEIEAGTFPWRDDLEDVHTHVEVRLRDKIGLLGHALHAGRSRNDQIATDLRLYVKDRTLETMDLILDLQSALHELASRYTGSVMPGYTHLQQAQPLLIAQPLLAYIAMLARDWERLHDSLRRCDRSPLGSGALAGATFPLDREFLARQCGFAGIVINSLDAVSDRDFVVEFLSAAALCMIHLSRVSEDIINWTSVEFGFVLLPDAFASGSSMMPQKKNPDLLELVRGKAALVVGDLSAALTLLKGLPLGYNSDLQEQKTALFHASETLSSSLRVLGAMIPDIRFNTERTETAISSFSLATDVADMLVEKGVPFREAHAAVGRLVAGCLESGRELIDLSLDELREASPHFDTLPQLTPHASVGRKRTAGSTGPDEVQKQLKTARGEIEERRGWAEARI